MHRFAILCWMVVFTSSMAYGAEDSVFGKLTPRHVQLPPVQFNEWSWINTSPSALPTLNPKAKTLDYSLQHYWLLVTMASWNPSSANLALQFNADMPRFEKRHVGVMGLFSEHNPPAVAAWIGKLHPLFRIATATPQFLNAAGNPKIPTLWMLDNHGTILDIKEMPLPDQWKRMLDQLLQLTDF